jgi:hypothetical protein
MSHVNAPVPPLSPELDPVFQRALAKDPAHRYPTATAFVADLRRALEPEATAETVAVGHARPRRSLLVPILIGVALLLLGGGIALAGLLDEDEQQASPPTTVMRTSTITREGTTATVTTSVTTTAPAPTTTSPPPPPPSPSPSGRSGQQLTDDATALLRQGRWAEAEAVARQAVAKLNGTGELYEAYANYNLARALVEQGRCGEALPLLAKSERIQGSRSEIREARARCQ